MIQMNLSQTNAGICLIGKGGQDNPPAFESMLSIVLVAYPAAYTGTSKIKLLWDISIPQYP